MHQPALKQKTTLVTLLLSLLVFVACSAQSPTANGQEKGKKEADKTPYSFVVKSDAAKVGSTGKVDFSVQPAKGYKWNENFPSSFTLADSTKVTWKTKSYDREAFTANKDKSASLSIPFDAKTAGTETIEGTASFSVCNDETCLIFRDEKVKIALTVK